MATSYPTSIDNLTNPSPTDALGTAVGGATHSAQHSNTNDAIEAIEGFVGVSSAPAGAGTLVGRIKTLEAAGSGSTTSGFPEMNNFKHWNYDPDSVSGTVGMTSGSLYLIRLYVPTAMTISNIGVYCGTAGTVSGVYGGLYTGAGARLSQGANQSGSWGTGFKNLPLGSSQALTVGYYYAALLFVHSSAPALLRGGNDPTRFNLNTAAPTARYATADTGLTTTMPANFGTQVPNNGLSYWVGLS